MSGATTHPVLRWILVLLLGAQLHALSINSPATPYSPSTNEDTILDTGYSATTSMSGNITSWSLTQPANGSVGFLSAPTGVASPFTTLTLTAVVRFTPRANWNGTTSFTVTVFGDSTSRVWTVNVTVFPLGGDVLRVTPGASTGQSGANWTPNAMTLQEALAFGAGDEIWVATGTYKPTAGSDRTATFQLPTSGSIYGGFVGGEVTRAARDWIANPTILSGDIQTIGASGDNSYVVMRGASGSIVDGFTIRDGRADGASFDVNDRGGGYHSGSATGTQIIRNSSFIGNYGANRAGALSASGGSAQTITVNRCTFSGNSTGGSGGAIYAYSDLDVTNSVFSSNATTAGGSGGAIHFNLGGGSGKSQSIWNSTFHANRGDTGAAIGGNEPDTITLTNNVFWGNTTTGGSATTQINGLSTAATLSYSIVQNGASGVTGITYGSNNLSSDPEFLDPGDADGADNKWASSDDGLQVRGGGPAGGSGQSSGAPAADLLGRARPQGSGVERGAYECRGVIYVNPAGAGTGTSWANGYTTIAAALAAAASGDEIWLKAGTYTPSVAVDRNASFQLAAQVAVYGGFAGAETARSQRNWVANPTILSGDSTLDGNAANNSYRVVLGANGALLDGVFVQAGNADGGSSDNFIGSGAGLHCNNVAMAVQNCVFRNNTASYVGGAMYGYNGSRLTVASTVFVGNTAPYGGAFGAQTGTGAHAFINCVFSGNGSTTAQGAAALVWTGHTSSWNNCTVMGNRPGATVPAFHFNANTHTVTNCVVWGNATNGAVSGSGTRTFTSTLVQGSGGSGAWNASYGTNGGGNLDSDPLVLDAADPDGADNTWLTTDDGLRLRTASPAANTGTASGMPGNDVLAQTRPLGGSYDMGAYEGRCPVGSFQQASSTVSETAGSASIPVVLTGPADYTFAVPWAVGDGGNPDVTAGTYTTTFDWPLYTYYHDARLQSIYLQSELGTAKTLRSLTLQVTGIPSLPMNTFTVRVKHTASSAFSAVSDWQDHQTDWTVVYQGVVTVVATGPLTIPFQTPFAYDGSNNLLVDFSFNNGGWASPQGYVQAYTPGGNRSLRANTDSGYGDPLTWSSTYYPFGQTALEARVPVATFGTALARGTLTISAGSTSGNVVVPILDDTVDEDDQVLSVNLGTATSAGLGRAITVAPTTHTLTITDDDATPTVQFAAASDWQSESVADRSVAVTLSGQSSRTITVAYSTPGGGTATAGTDFTGSATGTVTFLPTQTSRLIPRTVTADAFQEADETFLVAISTPVNAVLGATTQHTATIGNDDYAYVYVSADTTTVTESPATPTAIVTIALNASPAPGATVRITLASNDTSEATIDDTDGITAGVQNHLDFTSANWSTAQLVTVRAANDDLDDGDQFPTIAVTLSMFAGSDAFYGALNPDDLYMTVVDDDVAGITVGFPVFEAQAVVVDSGGRLTFANGTDLSQIDTDMRVVFVGGHPNSGEFRINSVDDAGDQLYVDLDGALYDTSTAQTATVLQRISGPVLELPLARTASHVGNSNGGNLAGPWQIRVGGDLSDVQAGMSVVLANQPTRTFIVASVGGDVIVLRDQSQSGLLAAELTPPTGTGTSQGVTIGGAGVVKARLRSQPSSAVNLGFASSDTSEGAPSVANLAFSTGNWSLWQEVRLLPINDDVDDGDGYYDLVVGPATGDAAYAGTDPKDIGCQTVDDDERGISVSTAAVTVYEGGSTATYTVALTSQPTASISITPTVPVDAVDDVSVSGALTFTTANWATPQVVTVTAVNDDIVDDYTAPIDDEIFSGAAAVSNEIGDPGNAGGYVGAPVSTTVAVTVVDNDVAGFTVSPATTALSPLAVPENGQAVFTVRLTAKPTAGFDVTAALVGAGDDGDGGSVDEASLGAITLSFTTSNWATPQQITILSPDDDDSAFETYSVQLTANGANEYGTLDPADVECRNADDDIPGITITQITPSGGVVVDGATAVAEGGSGDRYQVKLNTVPGAGFVYLAVGTPSGEVVATPAFLLFTAANYNVPQTVTLTALDDSVDEAVEIHQLDHSVVFSSDGAYDAVDATATAVLTGGVVTAVTVDSGGSGYDVTPVPTVSFVGGGGSGATATANVNGFGVVTSVTVNSGGSGYTSAPTVVIRWLPSLGVTVNDNDTAGITVSPTSGITVTEGGASASFFVGLTSQPTDTVTIALGQSGDTDEATLSAGPLVFTPANWNQAQQVVITGVTNESLDDGDRSFTVVTGAAVSSDPGYSGRSVSDVSCVCIDDDAVGVVLSKTAVAVTEGSGAPDTYTVRLASQPSATVTVSINVGTQVGASPASLVFTTATGAGGWDTAQTVTITAVVDDIDEAAVHTGTITHAVIGGDYTGVAIASVTASVTDQADDVAGFSVLDGATPTTAVTIASESGGTKTFTIQPTSKPTGTITVALAASDASVATVSPQSVTFTPESGSWNAPQTVTVTAVDDQRDTPNRTATIVTTVTATDPTYNGRALTDVAVTVTDNDTAGVAVSAGGGTITVNEGGSTASFAVVLTSQPASGATITVPLESTDTDHAVLSPTSLAFTDANWSTPQIVTVTGRDLDDADNGVGGVSVVANIRQVSVSSGSDAAFAALVLPANVATDPSHDVTVLVERSNSSPTFDPVVDRAMVEDDAALTVTLSGISSGQAGELQNVFVRATSSNPGLVPDPQGSDLQLLTAADTVVTHDLVLTPAANASGTAVITVVVTDDATVGGSPALNIQRSFTVTVAASDDAPEVVDNSSGAAFTEGGSPAVLAPDLTVVDVDSPNLITATVALDSLPDGSNELLSASGSGLVTSWDSNTGILTISGNVPPAGYQAALRSVAYQNASQSPTVSPRTATISVFDGSGWSTPVDVVISVAGANDAPAISGVAVADPIPEDVADGDNAGTLVSTLVPQLALSDVDAGDVLGIAVVAADEVNGSWQYTPDSGSVAWIDINPGVVAAMLLSGDATQRLRFKPNADFVGSATLTVRAWDQTGATVDGNLAADTSVTGGSSPYSSAVAQVRIDVTPVNDRPTIAGSAVLSGISEDVLTSANAGTTAAGMVAGFSIGDTDAGALRGLAVVGVDESNGTWEVSFDGGVGGGDTWIALAGASAATARLLPEDATVFVRFIPAADFNGTATISLRAWDQSEGAAGGVIDVDATTSCSSAAATATITVGPVNDAPSTLTAPTGGALNAIIEDVAAGSNPGTPVAALIDGRAADVDALASQGIAVTATTGSGTWQYSTNSGSAWNSVGTVSASNARLLTDNGTVLLRYLPGTDENGSASVQYRLWDRTSGTNGALVDPGAYTTTGAFSSDQLTSTIAIAAVNDPPVIVVATDEGALSGSEATAIAFNLADAGTALADPDAGSSPVGLTVGATNGILAGFISGGGVTVSGNGTAMITASGTVSDLAAWLDGVSATYTSNPNVSSSQTITFTVDDGGASGGAAQQDSAALTVTVGATNDAPVLGGAGNALPGISEDPVANPGVAIDDLVGGAVTITDADSAQRGVAIDVVTLTANAGGGSRWQYSGNGGGAWSDMPALTGNLHLLLSADGSAQNRVRYVPVADENGTATLVFRAWDTAAGSDGLAIAIAAPGSGGSAIEQSTSTASLTSTVLVSPVNDAPVLTSATGGALTAITEDPVSNPGSTVASLVFAIATDVDAGAASGIAAIATTGNGVWQYSLNSGSGWTAMSPAPAAAITLSDAGTTLVRFVPDPDWNGTATITYVAWDRTTGTNGGTVDLSGGGATGATTAYALLASPATSSIAVTPVYGVNIVASGGTTAVTEGGAPDTYGISLATAPVGGETITVTLSVPAGLQASVPSLSFNGTNWQTAQGVTVSAAQDTVDNGFRTLTITHSANGTGFSAVGIPGLPVQVTDDDTAWVTVTPTSGHIIAESGTTASFTVVLATQPAADVVIGLGNPAPGEVALSTAALTFTDLNWNVPQTVVMTGVDDDLDDNDVLTTIAISVAAGDAAYAALNPSDVTVTTTDNDTRAVIAAPGSITTEEGGASSSVSISLQTQPTATVTVALSLGGSDEAMLSAGSLTFTTANWATPQSVTVTGLDDAVTDLPGDMAFTLTATPSGGDYAAVTPATVAGINADDDVPAVQLRQTGGSTIVVEGGTTDTVSVSLSIQPTADVVVTLAGDADIALGTTTLTFTPVNFATAQIVTISAVNDQIAEGTHPGAVSVAAVTGASEYAALTGLPSLAASIADNDVAAVAVTPQSGLIVTETGGSATFQVAIATQPTADVTFALASSDGTAATVSPASITFTASDWQSARTITVTGVDDAIDDGDQPFAIVIAGAVSADAGYAGLNPVDPAGSCTDNDTAGVVVNPTAGLINSESGGAAFFTIQLASQPTADVVVNLVSDKPDQASVPASVTITAAAWSTPVTVTVAGVDDGLQDPNNSWEIQTAVTSADGLYNGIAAANVTGNNLDDDSPGVLLTASGLVVEEAPGIGASLTYQVRLARNPTAGEVVTVAIAPSGLGVGQVNVSPAVLTFTNADWSVDQPVTVTSIDDEIAEGAHGAPVAHIVDSSGGGGDYAAGAVSVPNLTIAIQDDDAAGVSVAPTSGLVTTEVGGTDAFAVVLDSEPTANVVINVASTDLSQGTVAPAQLTFTPLDWATPKVVTVTGADSNGIEDGNVLYGVSLTMGGSVADPVYAAINPTDVTLTNLSVANPPTLTMAASLTIAEDAAEQSVALSAIGNGQPLSETGLATVSVVLTAESAAGLITGLAVDHTAGASAGTLRFTPGADLSGTATVTVTVDDGEGQTVDRVLAVTVTAVNDQPVVTVNLGTGAGLNLQIGDTVPIDEGELMADDLESPVPANQLTFTIILPPSQGQLTVGGSVLTASPGSNTFTSADLLADLVEYRHTGVIAGTDGFAFTVTDPDAGTSGVQIFTFDIDGRSPPVISDLDGDAIAFTENGAALSIDTGTVLAVDDVDDPTLVNGFIGVEYIGASSPSDRISIVTGGSLGISATTLTWNGVAMGTISDDGTPDVGAIAGERLLITSLTSEATPARVTALLQALRFEAMGDDPLAGVRTLRVTVEDGDSLSGSATAEVTVTVAAVDDAPVIPPQTIVLTPGLTVSGQILGSDPEGSPAVFAAIAPVPGRGNLTLTADGTFTYEHTNLLVFTDSFGVSVTAGGQTSTRTIPVVISDVDPLAPAITSPAPMRIAATQTFSYTPTVTAPVGAVIEYRLAPEPEAGAWSFDAGNGTITWPSIPAPGDGSSYHRFGILVIDRTNSRASYQPITLKVTVGGDG